MKNGHKTVQTPHCALFNISVLKRTQKAQKSVKYCLNFALKCVWKNGHQNSQIPQCAKLKVVFTLRIAKNYKVVVSLNHENKFKSWPQKHPNYTLCDVQSF